MKIATFKMKGTKPILFHKFNIESITDTKKPKEGTSGNDPSEWRRSAHTEGTRIYVPANYLLSTFIGGGKFVKVGRGTVSKIISSAINIMDEKIYFDRELPAPIDDPELELSEDSGNKVYVDCRMVANPNTKGRNVRYRLALSPGWELNVKIEWDDTIVSRAQLIQTLESAGKYVGFCDARTLGYGRFDIECFEISD